MARLEERNSTATRMKGLPTVTSLTRARGRSVSFGLSDLLVRLCKEVRLCFLGCFYFTVSNGIWKSTYVYLELLCAGRIFIKCERLNKLAITT